MARRKADKLEESLQQAAQGKPIEGKEALLVQTAQQLAVLAEPPLPPPRQLSAGRQQFLAEAARMQAIKSAKRREPAWMMENMRLAGALVAAVLVIGLVFVGQVAADSLPGTPLYGLKQIVEQTRFSLTTDPETRAELATNLAQERLEEIAALLERGRTLNGSVAATAQVQLSRALTTTYQLQGQQALLARERLLALIQAQQQWMLQAISGLSEPEQLALEELLREMERVREELHRGQRPPSSEQNRQRPQVSPEPTDLPHQATPTVEPKATEEPRPGPGLRPTETATRSKPTEKPGPGPQPTEKPTGPKPTEKPGPGPQPTEKPAGPKPTEKPGPGPGPQPTEPPTGPKPTEEPGPGPGPQPTEPPTGPKPTEKPGPGPGPQPTEPPAGPKATEEPGPGPGPQPSQGPGGPSGSPGTGKP